MVVVSSGAGVVVVVASGSGVVVVVASGCGVVVVVASGCGVVVVVVGAGVTTSSVPSSKASTVTATPRVLPSYKMAK